jgi:hypothetical protein
MRGGDADHQFRDRCGFGDPQSALRHPASLGCPGHAFPGVPARRGEGSPDLRLSPVSPSRTSASPPQRPCSHPRAVRPPVKRPLTRSRSSTHWHRHPSPPSSLTSASPGSTAPACPVATLRPQRRSRRSPAERGCCPPSHRPGRPFLHPQVTCLPPLIRPALDPRFGSEQP